MKIFHEGRPKYGQCLEKVLDDYHVKQILGLYYTIEKRGYVEVAILTNNLKVVIFQYRYGYLEYGLDDWEKLEDNEICDRLKKSTITLQNERNYHIWKAIQILDRKGDIYGGND